MTSNPLTLLLSLALASPPVLSTNSELRTTNSSGNLTTDGTRTYTYDAENRLLTAASAGMTASYTYDAFGRRISKTVNGQTTRFLYDGDQLLEERSATGAFLAAYLYGSGIDEVLLRYTNTNQLLVYHHDALGSPQFLLDWLGTPLEGYVYDAYGTPSGPSAIGNRFLFTGREYDAETGLLYYRSRYYSPTLGRFLSRDPLGNLPDLNVYRYVSNNPLRWVDPLGLDQVIVGTVPGPHGEPIPIVVETTTNHATIGYPGTTPGVPPGVTLWRLGVGLSDPGRLLRLGGRILTESGFPCTGRALSVGGLAIEPGGPGEIIGIAAGGTIGAGVGGSFFGPWGGIVGGIFTGYAGGVVGSWFDPPGSGELE